MGYSTNDFANNSNKTAKDYFELEFLADDTIRQLNIDLVYEIINSFHPTSVFEFGCGQGKNLAALKGLFHSPVRHVFGIDINKEAVELAHKKGRGYVVVGDETAIGHAKKEEVDVAFTCSVLDHIPQEETVKSIVEQLKRISKKGVVLVETLADKPGNYYYPHDYEAMGFLRVPKYAFHSPASVGGDGNTYFIWKWFATTTS